MRTVGNDRPQQWVHMDEEELEEVCASVKDAALKHTLQFGIGLHHAGLNDRDRTLVETLFVEGAIQVCAALVCLCVCVLHASCVCCLWRAPPRCVRLHLSNLCLVLEKGVTQVHPLWQ